ncbi:MarR family transcriptional regulator [Pelagibacterales bacterium SAG-MED14]|nr:MarR family transcriptional regulator [Pelagibacterales bacterium SAG-MED14]
MEKIFTELYKDIHNSVQAQQDPFKKFLFSTRQHVLIIFYIASQKDQKTTLEDICYNVSPKVVSRSTIQSILKEGYRIGFFDKEVNENDKREKFYKLTNNANKLMQDWAHNQNTIFSSLNDLIKR